MLSNIRNVRPIANILPPHSPVVPTLHSEMVGRVSKFSVVLPLHSEMVGDGNCNCGRTDFARKLTHCLTPDQVQWGRRRNGVVNESMYVV